MSCHRQHWKTFIWGTKFYPFFFLPFNFCLSHSTHCCLPQHCYGVIPGTIYKKKYYYYFYIISLLHLTSHKSNDQTLC